MSNFGKNQLLKYGWIEGKGLGKNENGIAEALKPKLKFDTSGIGHKDNDFQWWNSVYDKALKNIAIDNKNDEVSIQVAKQNAFNISSKKTDLTISKDENVLCYGKFLKTSTLQDGNLIKDNTCAIFNNEIEDQIHINISDKELFNACGGRTAHKGARHGLKLSGKLARIAEQEKQLLATRYLQSNEEQKNEAIPSREKRKKVINKESSILLKNNEENFVDDLNLLHQSIQRDENKKLSKQSRRKINHKMNNLAHEMSIKFSIEDGNNINEKPDEELLLVNAKKSKKKKRKRKHGEKQLNDNVLDLIPLTDVSQEAYVKRYKKYNNTQSELNLKFDFNSKNVNHECNTNNFVNTKYKLEKKNKAQLHSFDVDKMNIKIKNKKLKRLQQKERKQFNQLSENLLAVNLNIGSVSENITENELIEEVPKKKKKIK